MLKGQPVRLSAPKTHYAKDVVRDKDTPIFANGKHTLVYIKNGYIDEKETKMMASDGKFSILTIRLMRQNNMKHQHVADALPNLFWACKKRDVSNIFLVKSC